MYRKILSALIAFILLASPLALAKGEVDTNFITPVIAYGDTGSALVHLKVSSDGTVATSGTATVTGTFWQATQPISGTVTDSITSATLITKTVDFSASETAQAIWTPTSGKKFVITDMVISCSAAGTITVFDSTDTTATRIVKGYFAANGGLSQPYSKPRTSSTADNVLKYTTGSGITGSLTIQGYEI